MVVIYRSPGREGLNVLVKKGDDLRKDELILQLIRMVGMFLEASGVENHFQYYACMATGQDEGFIEIVDDSVTLGSIYNDHNSISTRPEKKGM